MLSILIRALILYGMQSSNWHGANLVSILLKNKKDKSDLIVSLAFQQWSNGYFVRVSCLKCVKFEEIMNFSVFNLYRLFDLFSAHKSVHSHFLRSSNVLPFVANLHQIHHGNLRNFLPLLQI